MEVTFETTQGRRFVVEIWYFSTVRRIKEYILKQEGIPVESQRLFFQGKELEDDRDTEYYPIVEGSHVLIVLPDGSPAAAVTAAADGHAAGAPGAVVHVVASGPALGQGRSVALELDASCTVARLKEMLQERTDGALPATKVSVFLDKAEMEDDKALVEFEPSSAEGMKMEVRVVVRQLPPSPACNNGNGAAKVNNKLQQRMSVEVKWGAKTATLEVSDMDAVKELRAELGSAAPHLLLPNDGAYFFIYKQNVMEEERTLRWHDVKTGDTIEIFNGRVTGGA
ncbi:polyubiquitin-like [Aegilops tauschii subsp. strangulata]|uniref:Ubiquitin-like domain-containing protein n=3 Tax=Aegilops tauschii TaxID=37682 RepID=A0A453JKB0_AEGTS|nr:polyubiquitin-B-like [Aegilops tauschii subsp. strangulata]